MSGWNTKTQTFGLTGKKAQFWFRRRDVQPAFFQGHVSLGWIKHLLESEGVKVVGHGTWLEVHADGCTIWEKLSGTPANHGSGSCLSGGCRVGAALTEKKYSFRGR